MRRNTIFAALTLCAALFSVAAPTAIAQQGDRCGELRGVLEETALPAADPAQQSGRTAIHDAVQAGYHALQCTSATPLLGTIEFDRQFLIAGYHSRCPAVGPAPATPPAQTTTRQFNEAVPMFNSWAEANNAALNCRANEVRQLRQQKAIAGAAMAAWNWQTQRQAEEAATAFNQAQPRRLSR